MSIGPFFDPTLFLQLTNFALQLSISNVSISKKSAPGQEAFQYLMIFLFLH